ncbi:MAG: hypothetical protein WDN28_21875 [Chthoniobacter sp.]
MSQELQTPPVQRPRPARRTTPVHHHKSAAELIHEAEDASFIVRHRVKFIIAGVLALGVGLYFMPKPKPGPRRARPSRSSRSNSRHRLPPKLPPPPPPKVQPPPDKMEKENAAHRGQESRVQEGGCAAAHGPGHGHQGHRPRCRSGSSGTGLGGGNAIGGTGNGGNTGSKWGWYAGQVQAKIADALRQHPKTKAAAIGGLQVRIWPDATGRITRASLAGSTGNAAGRCGHRARDLSGLRLQEPPPAGMKLPIVLRLSAKRPN